MALKRMDNVGIVVEDLDTTIAFFRELGLNLEGRAMQVVQIQQYAAAGALDQCIEKRRLAHLGKRHRRIFHAVLEQHEDRSRQTVDCLVIGVGTK